MAGRKAYKVREKVPGMGSGRQKGISMVTTQNKGNRSIDRDRIIDWVLFAVLLVVVSGVTLTLFHKQTLGNPQSYHSDMKAYILEMQGLESKYNFPYPVFFKLAALIHLVAPAELSVAIATMLLNSLAIVITKAALNHLALEDLKGWLQGRGTMAVQGRRLGWGWVAGPLLSALAVSLFFISMLYPPKGIYLPGIKFIYLGVFTPNPFHNATYMAARPFAILAFLWFARLLPVYEKGIGSRRERSSADDNGRDAAGTAKGFQGDIRDYVLFSVFLLVATMTKPSFTIVLVGAAGLVMVWRLFRSSFRNLVPTICLGLCFVPTFADLLYQYRGVFVPEEGKEGGLGFCLGEVWGEYCDCIPLAVCLAVGFPLLVLVLHFKELKRNTLYRFSWQIYLMSFAMAFFLYEKGFRKADFNFSWGYMYGIFFCHLGALVLLLQDTVRPKGAGGRLRPWLLGAQWLAYLVHFVCGVFYFRVYWMGHMYY